MSAVGTSPRLSPGKRVLFTIATLIIAVVLGELAVLAIFRPAPAGVALTIPVADVDSIDTKSGREKAGLGFRDPSMTLHPYLGYVFLPKDRRSPDNPGHPKIAISEDGFLDSQAAVRKRGADRVVIGILGGSVSGQLGTWHSEHLANAFSKISAFQGRKLDFVFLGMPGYHQPQQTIQLNYILAQGGEFDYVINLDGFNELAVPAALNAPQGAHPLYPMNWSMVALDAPDTDLRRAIGAIDYLQTERRARNDAFATSPLRFSPTARLFRERDDNRVARRLAEYTWHLQSFAPEEIPYFVSGPTRLDLEQDELIAELVSIWKRASLQMHATCNEFGIRYVHLLQPNQYDPGSKPMSAEEKEKAYDDESPYRTVVEKGYVQLRAAGVELEKSGVAFHDLSGVFENERQTLYADNCCHFNGQGNRILAKAIADAIEASM